MNSPLWRRIVWFLLLWAGGVAVLAVIAGLIRVALGL